MHEIFHEFRKYDEITKLNIHENSVC